MTPIDHGPRRHATDAERFLRGRGLAVVRMKKPRSWWLEMRARPDGAPLIAPKRAGRAWLDDRGHLLSSIELPEKRRGGIRVNTVPPPTVPLVLARAFAAWSVRHGYADPDANLTQQVRQGIEAILERIDTE